MMKIQPSQRSFWVWIASVILLVVLGIAYQPSRVIPTVPRVISLHVDFNDDQTRSGGGDEYHQGTAVYTFRNERNESSEPMKLVFPPLGYTSGGEVPITPQCTDSSRMPTFCQSARIVELKPGDAQRFESKYVLTGPAGAPLAHFVFGPASDRAMKNVFVGEITSTSEIHPAK